ncbi:hypothetical protein BJ165DRAFT_868201 [Panaeolus papilionaceus]|nr:hypothetical protein BJ165DRAFT_868201 [Panaeolus papilionaceus]
MSSTARIGPAWNLQPLTGRSPVQEDSTTIIQPSALATGIIYGMMGANARMMFHGGNPTFQQHFEIFQSEEIRTLYQYTAPAAAYNAKDRYDPPKCHPNTRTGLLDMTREWANGDRARVMWLYGSAGAGKSAIAQTMSEELRAGSKLAASFFFSRTAPAESHRGHEARFVVTIAYQLSEVIQGLRRHVERAVVNRPSVFDLTLREQTMTLIIEPLKLLCHDNCTRNIPPIFPRIIVVDGLDECKDETGQKQVLEIIEMLVGDWDGVPPFSVFLASRPELAIQCWFTATYHAHPDLVESVSLLDHCDSDRDIKAFVTAEVVDIKDFHPFKHQLPPGWPLTQLIDDIVHRASGQFIYASTVMKYVRDPRHYPHLRLDYILKNTIPGSDQPYAELNALYLHILRSSRYPQDVLRVLAFHIFSVSFVAEIPSNPIHGIFATISDASLSCGCALDRSAVDYAP